LNHVKADLHARTLALGERGITPGLATVLVGEDLNSAAYVRMKHEDCAEIGINSFREDLPATSSQADVIAAINRCNVNPEIDGFIVQLPLPNGLDDEAALLAIDPNKDADGLHPVNRGRLVMGSNAPIPCTPAGIQALLAFNGVEIEGKHVVIIGRGLTIGRPLANLLALKRAHANAAVTVIHTGVPDLSYYTRQADILISAVGSPSVVTPDMVKPGAALVSAGISFGEGRRLIPDIDEACGEVAGWITPRIGGVGPTTRAMLLSNAVAAAERSAGAP
ncbi:MAG: bifunctional 5,10-methylenetetrahydrofolate dehydrogenase/5,10-methenyltetrahydrofolate cyclohydrolase, partial [Actinobacteria bacterium]|nr:bifunctional 5,10-methylenetetrahydrofolate dehydrogenase/5,10-methenyltetrahydrofolate cyclohydrolase [Actinomycetota bacterium]